MWLILGQSDIFLQYVWHWNGKTFSLYCCDNLHIFSHWLEKIPMFFEVVNSSRGLSKPLMDIRHGLVSIFHAKLLDIITYPLNSKQGHSTMTNNYITTRAKYEQLTGLKSNKYIPFCLNGVTAHSYPHFNSSLAKLLLKLGHEWLSIVLL